ncbi:ZIP family metal transporter [Deinococcus arcticus]|uniref:Metal transporter n=1 Tax=Deinococcus arcticus TaxID=2136176 RepID=A0A2T3W4J2_9DEIO|nr:metal transporter [Deinococcus arcticus]PTA66792.1 metal transporter [Deinococcus arcticus]
MSAPAAPRGRWASLWGLALVPLLLLGAVLAYLVATGGGMKALQGPPVEQVKIGRVTLPERGVIQVQVVNDGPQAVTLPQVMVDDAFWSFTARPAGAIPRLGTATLTIPYPWVEGEAHKVALLSSLGTVFEAEIPVATLTPQPGRDLFVRFGLVGLYVGVVPVLLGMLWFPWMRRLSARAMNFILALTVGLLVYLAVGTYLDAQEFAAALPAFWQGTPAVLLIALLTLGVLLALGGKRRPEEAPLGLSYRIATGIGLHNLGEGLAIGAAFALGEAALGTFLILGFTLHNITEGVGIVAPVVRQKPKLIQFALLALIAGGPAILGTWLGGFAFNPVLATIFLAVGVGAIVQVVWEVGRLVARNTAALGAPLVSWSTLGGFTVGVALMYFTAFFVKF